MKNFEAIVEDRSANVIGALTSDGFVWLPKEQIFPRSELLGKARGLSVAFGVTLPEAVEAKLPPADPA